MRKKYNRSCPLDDLATGEETAGQQLGWELSHRFCWLTLGLGSDCQGGGRGSTSQGCECMVVWGMNPLAPHKPYFLKKDLAEKTVRLWRYFPCI